MSVVRIPFLRAYIYRNHGKRTETPLSKNGFSLRGGKRKPLSEARGREAFQEIEAVIESFQGLTGMNVALYTSDGAIKMIDLRNGLEDRMSSMKDHPLMGWDQNPGSMPEGVVHWT